MPASLPLPTVPAWIIITHLFLTSLSIWLSFRAIDDYDMEKVEAIIKQTKELLKNSIDVHESERLLAKLEALEWLQRQIEDTLEYNK